jgi:MFS family permease
VSAFGSQITAVALPLTAVVTLGASVQQMAALSAAWSASGLAAGLLAGWLADRFSRRAILVTTDVIFAVVAGSIPAAAALGRLNMTQLFLVQIVSGATAMMATVAGQAFLPGLVARTSLVEANARLQVSSSTAASGGPLLGGVLVEVLSAPMAILVDAVSFALSGLLISSIPAPTPTEPPPPKVPFHLETVLSGLDYVLRHRFMRPLAAALATHFLFAAMLSSVFVLFATRDLGLRPALIGSIFGGMGLGLLVGSIGALPAARRWGVGRAMLLGTVLVAVSAAIVPVSASVPKILTPLLLVPAYATLGTGIQLGGINVVSLRQAMTPDQLQGRMTAAFRLLNLGLAAAGAGVAAALASHTGLVPILWIAALGLWLPPAVVIGSGLIRAGTEADVL